LNSERGNPQVLRITSINLSHNHETTKEYAQFLPENRRLDPDELEKVHQQIDVLGQPLAIRKQAQKHTGKVITGRDYANIK